jgi:hypothetical protein
VTIVSRGFRCTTFRDGDGQSGPFAVMRCDGCGAEADMQRKGPDTLTSPTGWTDDGPLDKCPRCAPASGDARTPNPEAKE